ncbi:MAG: arsenate reductase (glutaredoxin) [Rhodospirillales bacterium]|nr:arsenate reductase (glutaredoxin) [Rhodospirillales bacterium]
MSVTIYHNPRCSKSRQTLALLEERGIAPDVVLYLETPPDAATLDGLLTALDMEPRDLMRKKEEPYKALGLAEDGKSRDDLIAAMAANPILIERPIVTKGGKAALGRPPGNVLDIL